MKNLPGITEIIKIEPFKITCRWTTGEIKVMDFANEFSKWKKEENKTLLQLENYENFKNLTIKDGTLQWYSIMLNFKGLNGKQQTQPLDIDPDNLYLKSTPLSQYKLILDTETNATI